jgi:phosphatidylcholine synthase
MSILTVWAVHLLTASGAGLALIAAVAASEKSWQLVFLCLGIAFIVDGIDGPLARWARVKDRLPWFDGSSLDFVIDYTNYVFIPAYVVAESGLLSEPLASISGIVIAIVGALYFADKRMKTAENGFRGFPAVWNAVVYLLMVYRPDELIVVAVVLLFTVLTFLPVEFVHPIRVVRLRPVTLVMTLAWAVLSALVLAANLEPGLFVSTAFLVVSAYLGLIGFILQFTRRA